MKFIYHRPRIDGPHQTGILVDLHSCTANEKKGAGVMKCRKMFQNVKIEMTKMQRGFTFFPMAEDDYFMTVAILSGKLGNEVSILREKRGIFLFVFVA